MSQSEETRLQKAKQVLEKGNIEEVESFYEEAMKCYTQALEIYESLQNHSGRVEGLSQIARIHNFLGYHKESFRKPKRAKIKSHKHVVTVLLAFGTYHHGQIEKASEYLQPSIQTFRTQNQYFMGYFHRILAVKPLGASFCVASSEKPRVNDSKPQLQ